ncbi:MAG: ABC transporter permease [Actinomycetota bacterium]|nr:ABC transporter permease [Actinomycetota bacterium]
MIGAAFTITAKDLKERFRDRSAIMLAIVVPLGLAFVMNLTLGPVTEQSFSTDVAVHDADGGSIAAGFGEMLAGVEEAGFVFVTDVGTADEARALVDDHAVSTAYLLEAGLSEAVARNEEASIVVVTDPDHPIGSQVGKALADGFASEVNAVRLSVATALALGADDPAGLVAAAQRERSPILLADAQTEGRGYDFSTFYATGIAVFFMFFTVQFGVLSIIDERESGTMPRLLVAPISKQSILVGKLLASFLVGVASTIVLWFATTWLMGAEWGGTLIVVILIAAGVTAAMGLTAAIATFAKTAEQAGAITAFVVVVFGVLGGTFFPVSRVSGVFTAISRVTPHYWLMEGFRRSSAGEGIVGILPALGAILAFAIILGSIGLIRARDLVKHQ